MKYEREFESYDNSLILTWRVLQLLTALKVGKFDARVIEHWTWWTLVVQYRDERTV
jgi:hypothetical protein